MIEEIKARQTNQEQSKTFGSEGRAAEGGKVICSSLGLAG